MKKIFIGDSPKSTYAGIAAGALYAALPYLQSGTVDWKNVAIAVALYILGRLSGDSIQHPPAPPTVTGGGGKVINMNSPTAA